MIDNGKPKDVQVIFGSSTSSGVSQPTSTTLNTTHNATSINIDKGAGWGADISEIIQRHRIMQMEMEREKNRIQAMEREVFRTALGGTINTIPSLESKVWELERRLNELPETLKIHVKPVGCICPAGSNTTCRAILCPRRGTA